MVDGVMRAMSAREHQEQLQRRAAEQERNALERPEAVRGETHGDYTEMSSCAQHIKATLRAGPNWEKMAPHARETLELMATKMARIVHGDFSCYDHWDDLRGYPQLVLDRMVRPIAKD